MSDWPLFRAIDEIERVGLVERQYGMRGKTFNIETNVYRVNSANRVAYYYLVEIVAYRPRSPSICLTEADR